jgi:hypothetical protein
VNREILPIMLEDAVALLDAAMETRASSRAYGLPATAAATTAASATTTATTAVLAFFSFVHAKGAAVDRRTVELRHRRTRFCVRTHCHEREAA